MVIMTKKEPTFLLEVADDALSDELGIPDHVEDFLVFSVDQSKLEHVFCWVDVQNPWPYLPGKQTPKMT